MAGSLHSISSPSFVFICGLQHSNFQMASERIVSYEIHDGVIHVRAILNRRNEIERVKLGDLHRADLAGQYFTHCHTKITGKEQETQTDEVDKRYERANLKIDSGIMVGPEPAPQAQLDPFDRGLNLIRIVSIDKRRREAECIFQSEGCPSMIVSLDKLIRCYPGAVCEFCLH